MDYLKHYNNLVEKAKKRILKKGEYFEKHHIVPKSEGGSNELVNLVKLTAREHFLAHWLLYRADPESTSTAHSFWRMCRGRGKVLPENWIVISSRVYEEARLAHSKAISKELKGRKKTPEHVAKVVAANIGRKRTTEAKLKMSEAAKKRGINSGFLKLLEKTVEVREQRKIKVAMVDPISNEILQVFKSLKAAADYVSRDSSNIHVALKKNKKCADYFWKKL